MSLKEILKKHNFKFKKRFGQNFITDPGILAKIVDAAEITPEDVVIEVGPGAGTLTRHIAQRAKKVIAVEVDRELIPILQENLGDLTNVQLVEGDALKINLDRLVEENLGTITSYKVVANLPYYITTPLIMHFLETGFNINRIVVMVQKEVAERIVAEPGSKDYGALTVNIQVFTQGRIAFLVPRHIFTPQPDVDSAIVDLVIREHPPYPLEEPGFLRKVVTAAFGQRRKTLSNSLQSLGLEKEKLVQGMAEANIDPQRRGETLSLEEFSLLTNILYRKIKPLD